MDEKRGVSSEPASIPPVCFFLSFPDDFSILHRSLFFSLLLLQFAYGFVFFVSGCFPILQLSGEKRKESGLEERDELGSKRAKVRDLDSGNLCLIQI